MRGDGAASKAASGLVVATVVAALTLTAMGGSAFADSSAGAAAPHHAPLRVPCPALVRVAPFPHVHRSHRLHLVHLVRRGRSAVRPRAAVAVAAECLEAVVPSAPKSPAAPTSLLTLSESDNGKTVDVPVGSTIEVDLHSGYWTAPTSDAPNVLAQQGPTVSAARGACAPGVGCGSFETTYTAVSTGTAHLTATRASCGESIRCSADARTYTVVITVQ